MDKAAVVKFRNMAKVASLTLYKKEANDDGTFDSITIPSEMFIVCDNSLNFIDDNNGSVIWDDANEVLYAFVYNTNSYLQSNTMGISNGDKPAYPMVMIAVDYGEIQNIRFQLNASQFKNVSTELKMTDEQIANVYKRFFVETDQRYRIEQKRKTSYDTGTTKDGKVAKTSYDDNDEYNKTVHPVQF